MTDIQRNRLQNLINFIIAANDKEKATINFITLMESNGIDSELSFLSDVKNHLRQGYSLTRVSSLLIRNYTSRTELWFGNNLSKLN